MRKEAIMQWQKTFSFLHLCRNVCNGARHKEERKKILKALRFITHMLQMEGQMEKDMEVQAEKRPNKYIAVLMTLKIRF